MSEQLKTIVDKLNSEPFNKKLNLISLDSLKGEQLLQLVNDVFSEIDPRMKMDVKTEDPEQFVLRVLGFLRVLKYKPPPDTDLSDFRSGLISGEKAVVYHILEWTLSSLNDLKKRAYLGRFLVKVELSPDVEGDSDIVEIYEQYDDTIQQFTETHRNYELQKNSAFSLQEIRKDISHMEEEQEQISKKIERLKRKVESYKNKDSMLTAARRLREEQDRTLDLGKQKSEQHTVISHHDQKIQRLNQQLKDIRHAGLGTTPETLVQKLEEENNVNKYLVNDKLPKEVNSLQNIIKELERVVSHPRMGQTDLNEINAKIQARNTEINQLIEKRMMSNDPLDSKLSLFRQQAAIVARKKEAAAELLNEARSEVNALQEELQEKKHNAKNFQGEEVLRGDDFKQYVSKLRSKSNIYKKKRQELSEIRAECGVLTRTEEILGQKLKSVNEVLSSMEEQKGIGGFHSAQDDLEKVSSVKAQLDEQKGQTLEEMSTMVRRLTALINEKKAHLAPIIKELRPLRQQSQDLQIEYDRKKSSYDSCAAGLDSSLSKLEQDVNMMSEEITAEESRYHRLLFAMEMNKLKQAQIANEIKIYVSNDSQEKKKSLREQLNKKIQEQENQAKILRERQRELKDNHGSDERQKKMWNDLKRIMECKWKCFQEQQQTRQAIAAAVSGTSDRLVL